jgi:hypothetical protein
MTKTFFTESAFEPIDGMERNFRGGRENREKPIQDVKIM